MFHWFTVPFLFLLYRPLVRILPRLNRDRYIRLLVAEANAWFAGRFRKTGYGERVLFLPYCLRPVDCKAEISAENGLDCDSSCEGCRLGGLRREALELGYQAVYIVVSGRMHRDIGVLRSRDFIMDKIRYHRPGAILVAVCSMDLDRKYLTLKNLSPRGLFPAEKQRKSLIPQGVLLTKPNCRNSEVDWAELEELVRCKRS